MGSTSQQETNARHRRQAGVKAFWKTQEQEAAEHDRGQHNQTCMGRLSRVAGREYLTGQAKITNLTGCGRAEV